MGRVSRQAREGPLQIFITAGSLGRLLRFGLIAWFGYTAVDFL